MKTKPFDRNRARTLIMSDILSFYITRNWEPDKQYGRNTPSTKGFVPSDFLDDDHPVQVGDLVILESAAPSKWNIGWLREIEEGSRYSRRYLIESLDDGSLCWWSNVGLSFMPRGDIRERYHWTDRQFAFQKRWHKTAGKHGKTGMRVMDCQFNGDEVTLRMCVRWADTDEERAGFSRTFPDYRKVTIGIMMEAVNELEAQYKTTQSRYKGEAA